MKSISLLLAIMPAALRRSAAWLFLWMMAGLALEMLGLGLVVPALALMVGGGAAIPSWLADGPVAWLGDAARGRLLGVGLVLLMLVYAVKSAVILSINWRQQQFVARLQSTLACGLFARYLRQPWSFHLTRNSATLFRNMDTVGVATETVGWTLVMIAEGLLLLGVVGLLLWIEPLGALVVMAITIAAMLVLDRLTRLRLLAWGEQQHHYAALRQQAVQEGLHGVKESLLRDGGDFLDRFARANEAVTQLTARKSFVTAVPRVWFEYVAVAAICMLTAVLSLRGETTQAMIPTLGLFAAAAFRILPSVNRLATAAHMLTFNESAIGSLAAELAAPVPAASPDAAAESTAGQRFEREIRLADVSFRYPNAVSDSLHGINIVIPHGQSVGIIGSSGAGKSTLVDVMLGLLPPSLGTVLVDEIDIRSSMRRWHRIIGYVPQTIYLTDDSIRRNVAFGVPDRLINDDAVLRALKVAQLGDFIAALPGGIETRVGERGVQLSGGQRQRIGIARALYHDPHVLILDEATSALDHETEAEVMAGIDLLHGRKTIVVIAHRPSTVSGCDAIYRLEAGRIVHVGYRSDAAFTG